MERHTGRRIIPPHARPTPTPPAFCPAQSTASQLNGAPFAQPGVLPQAFPVGVQSNQQDRGLHQTGDSSSDANGGFIAHSAAKKSRKGRSVRFQEPVTDSHADAKTKAADVLRDERSSESQYDSLISHNDAQADDQLASCGEQTRHENGNVTAVASATPESEESEIMANRHATASWRPQGYIAANVAVSDGKIAAPSERFKRLSSPPKPPDPIYQNNGRFTPEANQWFRDYWTYLLMKGSKQGSLPTISSASKRMCRDAVNAGVHMTSQAFENYRKAHIDEFEEIETQIVGFPYQRGWHVNPLIKKRLAHPDKSEISTHKKPKVDHGKRVSQESIERPIDVPTIVLSDKERKLMKYQMDYAKQEGGRLSAVWEYMQRKFPQRGFTQDEWKNAYYQNMCSING